MTMDRSSNRYNRNSGSQNDLINQLMDDGYTDEQIRQILGNLQAQSTAPMEDATGGADIADFLTQQMAGEQDQQQNQNLVALMELLDPGTPAQTPELQLPRGAQTDLGSNFQSTGDGAADRYAAQQRRFEAMQALNMDQILRGRNREDALWMMQNQPVAAGTPADPHREQILQMIMERLMPKAQETASPQVQSYAGGTVTGQSPQDAVMQSQINEAGRAGVDQVEEIVRKLAGRGGSQPQQSQQKQGGGGGVLDTLGLSGILNPPPIRFPRPF